MAITLERSCFGCAFAGRVELRRDGQATLLRRGNARHATADTLRRGRVAVADFDRLARLVESGRFFALADRYEDDPELRDGAWAVLEVVRGAEAKQVFRREDAGPAALKQLEAAVLQLADRIVFSAGS